MRATIACATWKGSCALCKSPKTARKSGKASSPCCPGNRSLFSDSADSGRLCGAQPAHAAGRRLPDGPCTGGAERLVCLGLADSGGHSGCQHRQRAHQGGATAHRGGYRRPGGKNRAPAGRALAADGAAVLFPRPQTGNIHGRLNRSLEGTVKLIKLMELRPRRGHRSGGGGYDLHAAARLRGVAGGAGDSRGHVHRASPDRQARRRASAWS